MTTRSRRMKLSKLMEEERKGGGEFDAGEGEENEWVSGRQRMKRMKRKESYETCEWKVGMVGMGRET